MFHRATEIAQRVTRLLGKVFRYSRVYRARYKRVYKLYNGVYR